MRVLELVAASVYEIVLGANRRSSDAVLKPEGPPSGVAAENVQSPPRSA